MILIRIILTFTLIIIVLCLAWIKKVSMSKKKINYKAIEGAIRKTKVFHKLNYYISFLELNQNKLFPYFIMIASFLLAMIIYFISYQIFSVTSTSIIISFVSLFIPYYVIKQIYYKRKEKILAIFPTYIITLKTYIQVTNDIILAFKNAKAMEPLKKHIDRFNIYVEKGISVYEAFENLKMEIDIKQISNFIASLQVCYINGGNFNILLQRYANLLSKSNLQREKEDQENFSSMLVLVVLIIINIILLFSFVFTNIEYKTIITQTFTGKMLLNINIISYIFIYFMVKKVNKKGV